MGAAIAVTVIAHIGLPLYFLFMFFKTRFTSRLHAVMYTWTTGAYLALIWRGGAGWDWFSYFVPYIYMALFVAAALIVAVRARNLPWAPLNERRPWFSIVLFALIGAFFAQAVPSTITAREYPPGKALKLLFPLKGGTYHVGHGGSNATMNYHVAAKAQSFALDITKLNAYGTRARGLFPEDVSKYEIYGAEVFAPCSGEVIRVQDGLPDQKPGDGDFENLAGNHIVIFCHEASITVAHLKPGSVAVKRGDTVEAGQLLGRVGNSGNTSEPHLHIHAIAGKHTDNRTIIRDGEGVPLVFDGRFLVRNDRVTVP
ncbi:MAG TPA: M23 family metallopeptidase [Bdellovibrionales bacterium]|nr:M23 family metallopeptidase [Bdellovibrionales bacterium]